MSGLEKLMHLFKLQHYAILVMGFFELIAIIVGIVFARRDKAAIFFIIYLILDFSILLVYNFIVALMHPTREQLSFLVSVSNIAVSFVELLAYYYFFIQTIQSKTAISLLKFFRIVFSFIAIVFVASCFSFLKERFPYGYISEVIMTIEFLLLLAPCLVYFYELLGGDSMINLYRRPSFWIVTGIFFYAVISIPYLLIDRFVLTSGYKYLRILDLALYYIPFTINFIFLTKAFLCKRTLTI